MRSGDVALFDLDGTLLDCNSGALWVTTEWRSGRIRSLDAAWAAWWLGRYSLGLGAGLDQVFETAVARLSGSKEAELDTRTRAWFTARVQSRLRPGGERALAWHRGRGDRLVLATTSSLYAAQAAKEAFGLDDVICTRFEVVDGVFTGRISQPALGDAKAERVFEWAAREAIALARCTFYTDSATDLRLLAAVGHPVAVHPDRLLRREALRRGWPVVTW
ncbi:MAG: HAD family hydrolase [Deltaproteobacteria bacterium]|nr:HAD family hydrolase [Deltaproteobacteria bacterium]